VTRRLRRAAYGDAGTSLTELLVTMALFSVVMIAALSLSIGFMRTNADTTTRQDQVDAARVASEAMTRSLRTAVLPSQLITNCVDKTLCEDKAFLLGQKYTVRFYANLDNPGNTVGPSKVSYGVSAAGDLVEKIQVPDSASVAAGGGYYTYCDAESASATPACKKRLTVRTAAKDVLTNTGAALFSYFDENGTRLDPGSTGLSADDLAKVAAVELAVTVKSSPRIRSTTYIQRVSLPNVQASINEKQDVNP
jgi:type II secretory pathway pseudopilin PulG